MKRKISCILVLLLLLGVLCILPSAAYVRISYGVDCLADRGELIKSGLRGRDVVFTEADFRQALGVSRLSSVTVLSLPAVTDGILRLDGTPVVSGQVIPSEQISRLTFTAASDSVQSSSFSFCANSTAGTTALTCTLRLLDRINYAPTVATVPDANLSVMTRRDISAFGSMKAEDPEGDSLTYLIVSYPQKGTLTVTDEQKGDFRYSPYAGRTGYDSFSYVARDEYGNYSSVATVNIQIQERLSELVYSDMSGNPAYNAALAMAESNILLGSLEGDGMFFHPTDSVSRSDFVVIAMKAAGISPAAGSEETWFDDNDEIPASVRGYVATAQLYGYVSGHFDGSGLYFYPDRAITRAEAAVILNNILNANVPAVLPVFADSADIPVWAADAIYALFDSGVLTQNGEGSIGAKDNMTRAEAAAALYVVMQLSES